MNYEQAAEFLEVSKRQVRRYAADGRLPVTRLGHRTVRIARMDLERLKAKCTK
jgi:excisionase family DNA binding protein